MDFKIIGLAHGPLLGFQYIDKIDDKEKREYILQRLERLQSGQEKIDRKIDSNERKRQYDERRRDK